MELLRHAVTVKTHQPNNKEPAMPLIEATIMFYIETDFIPPEIPGEDMNGDVTPPISGAEQVTYEMFKKIQEVIPDKIYAVIAGSTVLER